VNENDEMEDDQYFKEDNELQSQSQLSVMTPLKKKSPEEFLGG
jgi:hypothetical protein